jgi:molybdate transport system substrate-binding protein
MGYGFEQANPTARVTFNFGASSQLAAQLSQGVVADVFATADTAQMDSVRTSGALTGPDHTFAANHLVLITPKDNPAHINSLKDVANPGVKFITARPGVPIGVSVTQLCDKAAADASYGSDFKSRVQANTVSQEDSVRHVVSKVQLGVADAAIVYVTATTPHLHTKLNVIQVPDSLQIVTKYSIAAAGGHNPNGGEAFVAYILGPGGQATLRKWGFLTL